MKIHHPEKRECVVLENHGQKIFGIFHRPSTTSQFPAVLICHGMGGHKVGRYRLYVDIADQLVKLGIGTLRIDFRGAGDSEGDFAETTLDTEVSDAIKGLKFLEECAQVDESRIGLIGRSLGGAVALMAASQYNNIKSICLWAPVFDGHQWQEKWKMINSEHVDSLKKESLMMVNGQIPGRELLEQIAVLDMNKYISSIQSKPLYLIHGEQDEVVNINHSKRYLQARTHANAETKFSQLPQSDHDFSPRDERLLAINETCQWFKDTL
jgi:dipeptidyl aminopeptidase/acylaminoacyl peptidase